MRAIAATAVAVVSILLVAAPAHATQHLISPGRNWESLDGRVRPGDHVLLMPGTHRSASFEKLRGTKERPIIIRALDPKRKTMIRADRIGLRLRQPQHVVIQDISIEGATINGITLTDEDRKGRKGEPATDVTIRNVAIRRIAGTSRSKSARSRAGQARPWTSSAAAA
jgi:hypothetical protein